MDKFNVGDKIKILGCSYHSEDEKEKGNCTLQPFIGKTAIIQHNLIPNFIDFKLKEDDGTNRYLSVESRFADKDLEKIND